VTRETASTTRPVDVDRLIYATITLMSVLIIYDGWQQLKFVQVVGVIVGPVLAMFLSHVFSASLALQVSQGRPITMAERLVITRKESRFLLICVPPVLLTGILYLVGLSLNDAIRWAPLPGDDLTWVLGWPRRASRRTERVATGASRARGVTDRTHHPRAPGHAAARETHTLSKPAPEPSQSLSRFRGRPRVLPFSLRVKVRRGNQRRKAKGRMARSGLPLARGERPHPEGVPPWPAPHHEPRSLTFSPASPFAA
jgi:hypothetical protein